MTARITHFVSCGTGLLKNLWQEDYTLADLQYAIQALLDELVESGEEIGLQAAVYVDGELVVDCVAGWSSRERDMLVANDTLFTIYSATKGVIASAVHKLAERGLIDYERPVAEYWPEFASAGPA